MPWIKMDDAFYDHEAWLGVSPCAVGTWLLLLAWSNRNLADGIIPDVVPVRLGIEQDALDELEARGRIHRRQAGGWEIHDYLDHQPSREQVLAKRAEVSAKRSEAGSKGAAARWGTDSKGMANGWQDDGPNPNPNPNPRRETPSQAKAPSSRRKPKRPMPDKFLVTDEMRAWVAGELPNLDYHEATKEWVTACRAKDLRYADFVAAWKNAMRRAARWHKVENAPRTFL